REPAEAIMIGDGLGTDIAAAIAVGARSILMLTGVTTRIAVDAAPPEQRPTFVAADAAELAAILQGIGP
nr:HAD hydrolase-like protein [Chloroflexota bacterium]